MGGPKLLKPGFNDDVGAMMELRYFRAKAELTRMNVCAMRAMSMEGKGELETWLGE